MILEIRTFCFVLASTSKRQTAFAIATIMSNASGEGEVSELKKRKLGRARAEKAMYPMDQSERDYSAESRVKATTGNPQPFSLFFSSSSDRNDQ